MYENRADRLSNNLRLNEISILSFLQFYCKINRNQLEIVVKATYDLHSNKYFEILNLTFEEEAWWGGVLAFIQIPRQGWDQMLAGFNKKRSCYSCLVLQLTPGNSNTGWLELLLSAVPWIFPNTSLKKTLVNCNFG